MGITGIAMMQSLSETINAQYQHYILLFPPDVLSLWCFMFLQYLKSSMGARVIYQLGCWTCTDENWGMAGAEL